jgi:hypothetical protein
MSKKSRETILSNLSRVLDPPAPSRRRGANLDGLLNEYSPPEQEKSKPDSLAVSSASASSSAPDASHTSDASLTQGASLAPEPDLALRGASLAPEGSLAPATQLEEKTLDLWAGVSELHTGYLRLYGVIVEKLYRHLDPMEQAVYTQLYALSWGYGNPSCRVSWPKLAERAGMGQTAAFNAVKRLVAKGMVEKRAPTLGKGKDQGGEFWLPLPARLAEDIRLARSTRLARGISNKDKDLKENNKKGINRLTPDEIQSFAATVADLLNEGKSFEEIEPRFTSSMHPMDWVTVKSVAVAQAQVAPKKGK